MILNGPGAGLAALLVLLLMASSASALTWEGINQQLEHCFALTNEAITLVEGNSVRLENCVRLFCPPHPNPLPPKRVERE